MLFVDGWHRCTSMDKRLVSHSKFLSLVLRHAPDRIGIELDAEGWVSIAELLDAAQAYGRTLDHDTLLSVVHENDKQRFAISSDGTRIRASQGHSVDIDLALPPSQPPAVLFHGTVAKFLHSIRKQGLVPGSRQHVHLSADEATASIVARRRGKPVILTINSGGMADDNCVFYRSANGVWLTAHVAPEFIRFPE